MKEKKFFPFLALFFALQLGILTILSPVPAMASAKKEGSPWPKCPSIGAEACCVMDLSSGLVLYSKNMKKKNFPASITKIMTSLLMLENCSLGEEITFSSQAVNSIPWDGTKLGVLAGETLSVEQSLYAIMIQSANDVCAGVAEYISGSEEEFARLMTKRAKELGCVNTHFTNPQGLHDEKHYTCAYDMCLIGREAMKNSVFRKVTASRTYTVAATNMSPERVISNHHQMVNGYRTNYAYEYDYCIGGKTGFTSAALNTLVTFAKKDYRELVCVVMRAGDTNSPVNEYTDTKKLIEAAFDHYQMFSMLGNKEGSVQSAVSDDSPMFTRYNRLLSEQSPAITVEEQSYLLLPKGVKRKETKQNITYYKDVSLSDTEETVIGHVTYTYDKKEVGQSDIIYHPPIQPSLPASGKITPVVSWRERLTTGAKNIVQKNKLLFIAIPVLAAAVVLLVLLHALISHIRYQKLLRDGSLSRKRTKPRRRKRAQEETMWRR